MQSVSMGLTVIGQEFTFLRKKNWTAILRKVIIQALCVLVKFRSNLKWTIYITCIAKISLLQSAPLQEENTLTSLPWVHKSNHDNWCNKTHLKQFLKGQGKWQR